MNKPRRGLAESRLAESRLAESGLALGGIALGGLALAIPAAVLALRTAQTGGHRIVLYADDALTELAVRDTVHGHQLLGPYSRFGWHHPGPAAFEWLAVFERALGFNGVSGLVAGIVGGTLAGAAVCWLVYRRAGPVAGLLSVAAVGAFLYQLGLPVWRSSWNPYLIVVPTLLLAVLCADGSTGVLTSVGLAWLVGSVIVQTHLGTAPVVAVWIVGTTVLGLLAARRRPRLAGLTLLGVGLIFVWLPPLIDQVRHHPGNATLIWRFFSAHHPGHGVGESFNALGTAAATVFTGDRLAGRPSYRLGDGGLVALGLLVVGLALTAVLVRARGARSFPAALAGVATSGVLVGAVANTRVVGPILGFFEVWFAILPILLALAVAATLGSSTGRQPMTVGLLALVAVVAAGTGLTVRAARAPTGSKLSAANVVAVTRLVAPALHRDGHPVLLDIADHDSWPVAAGLAAELERRGYTVHVPTAWTLLFGSRRQQSGREDQEVVVDAPTARPPGELGAAGGVTVGVVRMAPAR